MSCIGKNIRKIRTIKGLSQTDFANLFNLTRASISAYEENRAEPKIDVTLKIAKYFNIPIEALLKNEITVNEYARFNLQNIISDDPVLERISIPIVSAKNWDAFLKNENTSEYPTIDFPKEFIQGKLAIEVNQKISTDLHTGTLLFCTEQSNYTKTGIYLTVDKTTASVQNGDQIKKTDTMRFFRVFQKIEEINAIASQGVEQRLDRLEKQIQNLMGK